MSPSCGRTLRSSRRSEELRVGIFVFGGGAHTHAHGFSPPPPLFLLLTHSKTRARTDTQTRTDRRAEQRSVPFTRRAAVRFVLQTTLRRDPQGFLCSRRVVQAKALRWRWCNAASEALCQQVTLARPLPLPEDPNRKYGGQGVGAGSDRRGWGSPPSLRRSQARPLRRRRPYCPVSPPPRTSVVDPPPGQGVTQAYTLENQGIAALRNSPLPALCQSMSRPLPPRRRTPLQAQFRSESGGPFKLQTSRNGSGSHVHWRVSFLHVCFLMHVCVCVCALGKVIEFWLHTTRSPSVKALWKPIWRSTTSSGHPSATLTCNPFASPRGSRSHRKTRTLRTGWKHGFERFVWTLVENNRHWWAR